MRRLILLLLLCAGSIAANAATFTVNNTGDAADAAAGNGTCATSGGVCTLRAALNEANALAGTDTINFGIAGAGPHTIAPASPLPVASSMIIDGTTQLGIGAGPFILLDGTNTVTAGLDFATMSGLNVTIQGLAIGRFTLAGIRTYQISSAVTVKRCHIGVGTDGITDMGNGDGIWAQIRDLGGSSLIVGDATGGGNVISGNADMGIEIDDSPTGSKLSTFTLQGNIIGLASDGMTQVANSSGAIRTDLQLGNVTIGGSVAGRNIISGNGGGGFLTSGFLQTDLLTFSDNYVGVAIDGNTPRGNNGNGATLVAKQYVVENNIVAANTGHGLTFATSTLSSPIRGNRIGVTADGSAAGNGGSGIVWSSQNAGVIGGPATADQNIIAYNGASGVRVQGGQTEIAENAIFLNGTLGIDLGTINVVDANDVNDADTGGNGLQNRPVISSAMRSGGVTFISGSLSSTPSTAYVIRIFSNTAADPSGFGEGETFVTSVNVTTNAGGTAAFNITTAGAPAGTYVSATATSAGGDTSEFSNAQLVGTPPQMRFASASYVTSELGSVTLTIVRVGGTGVAASVNWATSAGSATAADFAAASGVVNFSPSDTTRTITIAIAPDVLDEIDETFTVTLATPTNADLGAPSVATVQITDDDLAPSVSIGDASINEGNAGSTSLPFNVTLSAASGKPITVDYVTSNGTATAASDYAAIAGTLTFAPGQTVKSIVAQLVGDTSIETNETFTITLSNPVEVTIGDGSATGTIVNDDGLPAITIGDVAIVEGDAGTSTALFTVTLSGPTTATVTANWSTASGTATAGVDYEAASGTVTFAPGELTKSIAVTINGDALVEDNETFTVDLASPANATLADAQGGGTIADDDGTPSLSINDPAVVEGVGATFTVTLAPASALPVTVNYATSNLTATATNDYTTAANTLTFAAGETTKLITVATSDDAVAEPTEDFAITLSGAAGATLGDAGGIATIIDNDGAPRITIGNVTAAETNSGTVAFTFDVDLSHASASTVTVDYSTADGTATAGSGDYATGSGTLTFAPAVTSQSITVMVSGDAIIEPDETLVVTLGNASNAIVIDAEGVATIANDDGAASVSIANATIDEGTGGALDIEFEVTLNAASALPVTVQWATADGTANASDYTAGAGTITFAPGEVLQTIAIAVNTDTAFEPNESFVVNLLGATNASISDAQGTGTLINDDAAPAVPVISIGNASLAESNAGTTLMTFAVQLDVATINTVSVDYATGDGAATAGTDYVATNGTLTFSPGVTTLNVTVPVIGDTLVESNETFAVTLTSPSNATLGIASGTGTILEDDVAPVVPSISIAPASLAEGNAGSTSMTFAVQLNVPTVATVTVNYATSNGTAIAGTDYANTSGTLTFAPGVTTQNISVPIIGDTLVESNETFAVTLTSPSNATLGTASANGTILDDDVAPVVPSISIAPASLPEGNAGSTSMTFAVQLNVPTVATVSVNYATSDVTAIAGSDYAITSGTLTFAPGVSTQTISVPIIGDTLVESNESFAVTLTSPSNATLGTASANGTIVEDDVAAAVPSIAIASASVTEGNAGSTSMVFAVQLSVPTVNAVTVNYATSDVAATAGNDYASTSGTLTFAPGVTSQSIAVPVIGDVAVESNETFLVTLTSPSNATLGTANATGTIFDDDSLPFVASISIADVARNEGDSGATVFTFPVTLDAAASVPVSVAWSTSAGSASASSDFVAASGTLVFAPGMTSQSISIAVHGDDKHEPDETFAVTLSAPSNGTLADANAIGTIRNDDDRDPAIPVLTASAVTIGESAGEAFVTLALSSRPASGASLRWMTRGGTASGTTDFVEASGRITFTATTATIPLSIVDDDAHEDAESFVVELFDATGVTLQDVRVQVTITDDDVAATPRAIVFVVGALHGDAGSRFGTAVQMVNASSESAGGTLVFHPAATSDSASDVTIPYTLAPRELRAWDDFLTEHGLSGLGTLDVIPTSGAIPHLTVRVYDDGSDGTTGFSLPIVAPSDALIAGDTGLLITPNNPTAARFNVGVRTFDEGVSLTIHVRNHLGTLVSTTARDYAPNYFQQLPVIAFTDTPLQPGDYLEIVVTHGSALLYGATVDNITNDPSVQVVMKK